MTTKSEFKSAVKSYLTPRNLVRVVVGHSTRFVIATSVTKLVAPEKSTDKVKTYVGGYAIGHLLAEHTEEYALRTYDKAVGPVKAAVEEQKNLESESETPTE